MSASSMGRGTLPWVGAGTSEALMSSCSSSMPSVGLFTPKWFVWAKIFVSNRWTASVILRSASVIPST